jgi:hypothetical protein
VEFWKTGHEKRKKVYYTKNVVSTFYYDARQASVFCYRPRKYATNTRKSIKLNSFDSLKTPFHYHRTHDSNFPEFQHSNWGDAPNLSVQQERLTF